MKYIIYGILVSISLAGTASASEVVTSIPVGSGPVGAELSPSGDLLYVGNSGDGTVSVVDTNTNTVKKVIDINNGGGIELAISPNGTELYVSERAYGRISVIDAFVDTVVARIDLGIGLANSVSFSPDGLRAFVASAEVNGAIKMAVVDTRSRSVVDNIITSDAQNGIIFNGDGSRGYLQLQVNGSNPLRLYTDVIDMSSLEVIETVEGWNILQVSSDGQFGWGRNFGTNMVGRINLMSKVTEVAATIPSRPSELLIDNGMLYVSSDSSGSISVLNSTSLVSIENIPTTGQAPMGIVKKEDISILYVVNNDSDVVDVIRLSPISNPEVCFDLFILQVTKYVHDEEIRKMYLTQASVLKKIVGKSDEREIERHFSKFIEKIRKDVEKGKIAPEVGGDLVSLLECARN